MLEMDHHAAICFRNSLQNLLYINPFSEHNNNVHTIDNPIMPNKIIPPKIIVQSRKSYQCDRMPAIFSNQSISNRRTTYDSDSINRHSLAEGRRTLSILSNRVKDLKARNTRYIIPKQFNSVIVKKNNPKKFFLDKRLYNILTASQVIRMMYSNDNIASQAYLPKRQNRRSVDGFRSRYEEVHKKIV